MKNNSNNNFNDTIGYLLFKKIFSGYIILVLIITIFQINSEYSKAKEKVFNDLVHIQSFFYDELLVAMNSSNNENIEEIKEEILKEDIVSDISIYKNIKTQKESEIKSKKNMINYSFNLNYGISFINENSTTVVLHANTEVVLNEAKKSVLLIILHFLLSIFIFWVLIRFYTNKYLTIPLQKLINGVKNFEEHDDEKVTVKLKLENMQELTVLANAFNKMSGKISEDIINLKQLTMIQNQQKKALLEANKAKDDFLANMSHELKTPLNSINLISSIMMKNKNKSFDEKEIKSLGIINNCGNDLLFLINDVLDLSKLEAGEMQLSYEQVELKELMTSVKDMFEAQIKAKNLDFIFDFDDKIEKIYTDKHRLKQIVKNLLSNSLKFVEKGSIKLIIKDNNENIKIEVLDDGIGISKDKLEHIFDRFKQADGSTTRKYGGTGLGLSICKDLAKLFEGDIKIESEVNKGTKVIVTLPKHLEMIENTISNEVKKTIPKAKKETKEENFLFDNFEEIIEDKKRKIFLLNSDPINYMKVVIELKKAFIVEQDFSFENFLSKIDKEEFDLLIIDTKILNTKENILENIEDKNFILVHEDNEILDSKLEKKAKKILNKPIDIQNINKTISNIFN